MLLDVIEQRHICISLRIFDPEDLATGWEVKAIIENPDIFEDYYLHLSNIFLINYMLKTKNLSVISSSSSQWCSLLLGIMMRMKKRCIPYAMGRQCSSVHYQKSF